MEILFIILCAIFGIIISALGVKRNIRNTKLGTRGSIRNSRTGLNDLVSDHKRLERDKDRIQELDERDVSDLRRCSEIGKRIRKREQKADISE